MRVGLKRIGGGALRRLVAERNIRSILFHLSEETSARVLVHCDALQAVEALQTCGAPVQADICCCCVNLPEKRYVYSHGFKLGFVGTLPAADGPMKKLLSMFDSVERSAENPIHEVYDKVAASLHVPLHQQLVIAEGPTSNSSPFEIVESSTTSSLCIEEKAHDAPVELLSEVAKEVVGSENCLDTSRRQFGPYRVAQTQIFYESRWSFALVNLKPIVPGHVLVVPKRCVARFDQLSGDEVSDLWCTAQLAGRKLEPHYGASSLTFAIQDGPAAGQTVPHVHIHVIPRVVNDFECNDDIYTEIEKHEQTLHVDNDARIARTETDMAEEASALRQLFL